MKNIRLVYSVSSLAIIVLMGCQSKKEKQPDSVFIERPWTPIRELVESPGYTTMDLKDLDITHLAVGDSISIEKYDQCHLTKERKCIIVKEREGYSITWMNISYAPDKETGSSQHYPEDTKTVLAGFEKKCVTLASANMRTRDSILNIKGELAILRSTVGFGAHQAYAIRSGKKIWMIDYIKCEDIDAYQVMSDQLGFSYERRTLPVE